MSSSLRTGTILGPYEITAKLGEGGMGEVYRAHDTKLKRDVAIKVLPQGFTEDKERLARFEREAQLLAQLQHPNIASIYGMEESDGTRALVLELVEGPTLAERLEAGPFSCNECLSVCVQIAHALEEAHEKGIVHRDLKPQNIKASMEGKVKVLDFGLAKAMDPAAGSAASAADLARSPTLMQSPTLTAAHGTQLGVILGTAAYMSPEQARGGAVDRRADIWAFGVVLFEMLSGRSLFVADTVSDTLAGVLRAEIDFASLPESTPPAIRRLLRRCLERDPKNRLRDIGEARIALSGDLTEPASGVSAGAAAAGAAGAGSRTSRALHALPWAVAAGLAILVAVLALRQAGPPPALPLRTAIDLPSELTLDTQDHSVALSPDGRQLLLAADDETSGRHLYLRALDKLEVRRLAGTEGATYPFWSPDGRAIGFFADRKLRRFDLPDGPVRTLCDAPAGRGATWGAGDRIVFAPAAVGGLQEVAAAGGTPQAFGPEPPEGASFRLPHFLPQDAGLVHYSFGTRVDTPDGVVLLDSSGREGRPLYAGESEAHYVAPGFLAFEREGLLMLQPFDLDRRELTGTAVPIADELQYEPDRRTSNFSFSATGDLVYQLAPVLPRHQLEWLDRQGTKLAAVGEPAAMADVRISPDGKRALVTLADSRERGRLWMLDLVRGARTPFTPAGQTAGNPVWSPDGRQLALYEFWQGVNRIAVHSADGAAPPRPLLERPEEEYIPTDWSLDGSTLLFSFLSNRAKQYDIALLAVDGKSAPKTIVASPAEEVGATFSPDGKWIAYASDESGQFELYVVAYPALGRKWPVTTGGVIGRTPIWISPTELAYVAADRKLYTVHLRLTEEGVEAGAPRAELGGTVLEGPVVEFVPALNRFLVATPLGSRRTRAPLVLMTNWRSALAQ